MEKIKLVEIQFESGSTAGLNLVLLNGRKDVLEPKDYELEGFGQFTEEEIAEYEERKKRNGFIEWTIPGAPLAMRKHTYTMYYGSEVYWNEEEEIPLWLKDGLDEVENSNPFKIIYLHKGKDYSFSTLPKHPEPKGWVNGILFD